MFALFRVSEKFPWHGSELGLVVIIIPEAHAPFLWKEQCFHYTLQSVFLHLISLEPLNKPVRRVGQVRSSSVRERGRNRFMEVK